MLIEMLLRQRRYAFKDECIKEVINSRTDFTSIQKHFITVLQIFALTKKYSYDEILDLYSNIVTKCYMLNYGKSKKILALYKK